MQAWSYIPHRQGPLPATRLVTNRYPPPSICGHGRRGSDHAVLYNGDSKPRHTVLNRWHPGWVKRSRGSLDQLCVSRLVVGPGRAIKRYWRYVIVLHDLKYHALQSKTESWSKRVCVVCWRGSMKDHWLLHGVSHQLLNGIPLAVCGNNTWLRVCISAFTLFNCQWDLEITAMVSGKNEIHFKQLVI